MVKLIGAVMTGFACGYFGFRMRLNLKQRADSLAEILTSLEMLESEINFSLSRLKKAFERVDRNGLFKRAAEEMETMNAGNAWKNAVYKMRDTLCIKEADCEALCTLSPSLGRTDVGEQIKSIRYVKELTRQQYTGAKADYERLGKLCSSGGILAGITVVIILI